VSRHTVSPVDAFDLPSWLGEGGVRWVAESSLSGDHLVTGRVEPEGDDDRAQPCDLLACDRAYPAPVLDESSRADAHQAWTLGEVLLLEYDGRLTLVVPGSAMTAELALDALRRLAKAVGAPARRFAAVLRL
jgi:hypothetical protein